MLALKEINGQPLTVEQTSYLDGLFAGIRNRGLTFEEVGSAPSSRTKNELTNAAQDLIFEEEVKQKSSPLDAFPLILQHSITNQAPGKEEVFRFKWHGLFYLSPIKNSYMARLRIPGGQLKSFQLRELANVAEELTTGYVQITTRANFQIRLIEPRNTPEFLRRVQSVGLHTKGAGADNVRNITANPTAGVDPYELIDTLPFCRQMAQVILNTREFYDLPRKFNIAFDGGGLIGTVENTNDIGLSAVRVLAPSTSLPPGIYFRVKLGGATGHKAFASDLGVLVTPEEVVRVTSELLRVYIKHGERGDRKKARLKHLLETWSLEKYLSETEKLLSYTLIRSPLTETGLGILQETSQVPSVAHSHVGVYPQKQSGLNYIGVAIPVGHITPQQMLQLADLVDQYGSGEIRLTVWQNLVIPNVPDAMLETLKVALVKIGLRWKQSNLRSGIVACTGNSYCKFAASDTKGHAIELATYIETQCELDQPINIHLTGCPNSCAQHYMGDIGLLGTKVKVSGESVDGYHVFVGGGFDRNKAIGRQLFSSLTFGQIKEILVMIVKGYLQHRQAGETFQQFTSRHDLTTLQTLFGRNDGVISSVE